MVDTHTHVLFGVDDGAKNIDVALEMMKISQSQGVKSIFLTPHYRLPTYDNAHVAEKYEELKAELTNRNDIDMDIHLGNEIYLDDESVSSLLSQRALTMGDSKYILVELPFLKMYPYHENLLYQLRTEGYKIILAHVDRYDYLMRNEELLRKMIMNGYCMQMSTGALVGFRTRKRALSWIRKGYIHLVATDMHDTLRRKPNMHAAYRVVRSRLGLETADKLFKANGMKVVRNENMRIEAV